MISQTNIVDKIEEAFPGMFWIAGRGRMTGSEPMYGLQIINPSDADGDPIAQGQGHSLEEALRSALRDLP